MRILDLIASDANAPVRYYGSTVTGADGRWTITGVPPGDQYVVDVGCHFPAAQVLGGPPCVSTDRTWAAQAFGAFYTTPVVANQIVQLGDTALPRALAFASSATPAAGAFTLSWSAIPGAVAYCIGLIDTTTNAFVPPSGATCGPAELARSATSTASWSTTLIAGHGYTSIVFALDRPADASFAGLCFLWPGTSFTCLAEGEATFTAR